MIGYVLWFFFNIGYVYYFLSCGVWNWNLFDELVLVIINIFCVVYVGVINIFRFVLNWLLCMRGR